MIAFPLALFIVGILVAGSAAPRIQDSYPPAPRDHNRVYVANATNALEQLPFETGTTPIRMGRVAANDRTSYIELQGLSAEKAIDNVLPRFYLFVEDRANVHPPFIVRMTQKKGMRRVTAMAQKGLEGFAIYSEEIVKPHYRVLSKLEGVLYMEIRPRESLAPGEYAIIGTDLQRIATFRIQAASKQ